VAKDGPGGEKTEKPTPQRLKKARKEGQIPRTPELGAWLVVAAGSVLIPMTVQKGFTATQELFVQSGTVFTRPTTGTVTTLMGKALSAFLSTALPMSVGLMIVGVVANVAQGGVAVSAKGMKPSLKKLNPLPGIKRMFGGQGLWEASKALVKTTALGVVVWLTASRAKELVAASGSMPLSSVAASFSGTAVNMLRIVAVTGLAIALADYMWCGSAP
jgi:flagellar biosynthetic protein FlhB